MGIEMTEDSDFRGGALYQEFLDIVISGGSYKGIADLLAQKLQASILIEDEFFRVLARSFLNTPPISSNTSKGNRIKYWKPQRVDPIIINNVRLAQNSDQPVELPELPDYGIHYPRLIFQAIIKNKITGYLHIFKKNLNLDQRRIVQVALHSLVLLETCRHGQEALKDGIMKNLILGLISNSKGEDSNLDVGKGFLGFDLSQEAVLAVVQIKTPPGLSEIEKVLHSINSDLCSCIPVSASATAISDEQAVLLIQSPDGNTLESNMLAQYLQSLFEALKMIFKDHQVRIGVGRQCNKPQHYKVAFGEACKALSITGLKPEGEEGVIYYYSVKLMGFMMELTNVQTLQVFVQRTLGKLHEYGVTNNIDLLESLECYLNHNSCIQSAAGELYIHPNTLRYRLEKVGKISGLDLTNNDTKLEIQLAIKLFRYQEGLIRKV